MKTLTELDCYMHFGWNNVLECWNGYLTKEDPNFIYIKGVPNHIKCFVHNTKELCTEGATVWANQNKHSLKNYKKKYKDKVQYKRRDEIEAELAKFKACRCKTCNHENTVTCPVFDYDYGSTPKTGFGCITHWEAKNEITS